MTKNGFKNDITAPNRLVQFQLFGNSLTLINSKLNENNPMITYTIFLRLTAKF